MVGLFALVLVSTPLLFAAWLVNRVLSHRLRVAELRARVSRPALVASELPPELESRLRNLEDIVCSLEDGPDLRV
jgi:hypothetical protein